MNKPPKPILSPEFAQLVADSNLELVLCGGQGCYYSDRNYQWLLRYKNEVELEEEYTRNLQKAAKLAVENERLKQEIHKLKGIKEYLT